MKTLCALLLMSVAANPEPGRGHDLDSDLQAAKGTKECPSSQTELCEATILEVKATDANIFGGVQELAEEDGVFLELDPHDQAAPFALHVEFKLSSCATSTTPFFLRVVTRADPPLATRIALMDHASKRYDGILETKTYLESNDYAARVGAPRRYVSEDGRIYLSLSFQLLPAPHETLVPRGAAKIGIDLDKIEIFE